MSKGLGRMELEFNMRGVSVTTENEQLIVQGKTIAPVTWDFRIAVSEEELPQLMKLAACKTFSEFFIRFIYNRSIRALLSGENQSKAQLEIC